MRFARDAQVIEGPVMEAAARNHAIVLEGEDEVAGRKAYRLSVKTNTGALQRIWVDAETFLETKYERKVRSRAGAIGVAPVYLRDYQDFQGLKMPTTIETGSQERENAVADKMILEKIALNPELRDEMFAKSQLPGQRRKVTVDARGSLPPVSHSGAAAGGGKR